MLARKEWENSYEKRVFKENIIGPTENKEIYKILKMKYKLMLVFVVFIPFRVFTKERISLSVNERVPEYICIDLDSVSPAKLSSRIPKTSVSKINQSKRRILKEKLVEQNPLPSIVEIIHQKKSNIFKIPFEQYRDDISQYPIGIFDSGIGGLTVLEAILKMDRYNNFTYQPRADGIPDFSNEHFIYHGDQANMPYGNYPSEGKTDFLRELIIKDAAFLLGNRYWHTSAFQSPSYNKVPVKAIVIACNTATAYGLEDLKEALRIWDIPIFIIGVVNAGADGALKLTENNNKKGGIAIMATVGTCNSNAYITAIERTASKHNVLRPPVVQQGCVGLAGAIEGESAFIVSHENKMSDYRGPSVFNPAAPIDTTILPAYGFIRNELLGVTTVPTTWKLNSVENYIRYHTVSLVEKYRHLNSGNPINTVILGCTHFPFYQDQIQASFQRLRNLTLKDGSKPYFPLISDSMIFIDPAVITADQLYQALVNKKLLLQDESSCLIRTDEFYISVVNRKVGKINLNNKGEFVYEYKYGREVGCYRDEYVKRIPLDLNILSQPSKLKIQNRLPTVWESLVQFNKTQ